MTLMGARMTGVGGYLPPKIVTNHALAESLETSDDWIQSRSGIRQRRIADETELTSDLGTVAARVAMRDAGIEADQVDCVIVATTTPDRTFPATAAYVQHKLGLRGGIPAFDVQAVCSGFVYALSLASAMISSRQARCILVIGAETMSRLINWEDRGTAVLFGDGAGAVVVEASPDENYILGHHLACDGVHADLLCVDGGVSFNREVGHLTMQGKEVFRHAVENISDTISHLLAANQLSVDDIDWFVPHQANARIIKAVGQKVGLPDDKIVLTVSEHANTSAASIPLALWTAKNDGRIRPGHLVMTEAMGGGFTWGGNLFKF